MTSSPASNRWLVLVMVCIAQFMVVLDGTVVNVALPHIQSALDFSPETLPWVINAYTLVFGGFLLLGGRAGDLIGRKRLFLTGLVVFTIASVLCGLAQNSELLLAARALQGLGGAMVSPAALSIVTTTFHDSAERAKALSVWAAIAVGGSAVGLLAGGVLTEALSWEWIFFINAPIGLATLLLSLRIVPESRMAGRSGVDIAGAVSVTAGVTLLVFGIVKAEDYGWGSLQTWGILAGAVALLALFVVIERLVKHPLVRLGIFKMRALTTANLVMLAVMGGMFGVFYFTSIYTQNILGFSAVETGLAFLPMTAMIIVFSGVAQQSVGRVGPKNVALVGMVVAAGGLLLLRMIEAGGSYSTHCCRASWCWRPDWASPSSRSRSSPPAACVTTTRAWPRGSSTRRSRWAARWASPSSARWPTAAPAPRWRTWASRRPPIPGSRPWPWWRATTRASSWVPA